MLLLSTTVTFLSETAQLPAVLYGGGARYLTSLRTVASIPIEYFGALWFLALIGLCGARRSRAYHSLDVIILWSGTIVCGIGASVSYQASFRCVPVVIATAIAAYVWVTAAVRSGGAGTDSDVRGRWSALASDWKLATSQSSVVTRWVVGGAVAALMAQHMALATTSTTSVERDAALVRWYVAKPRLSSPDITAEGKIRVVVFSDYECLFCSLQVPEFQRAVNRYREAGHRDVELVVKDFPLNSDCNPAVQTRMHPLACEASAAVRFVRRVRGDEDAQRFSALLYRKHGKLSNADIHDYLAERGLRDRFREERAPELDGVRQDARLGERLGVTGTPAVFVDGRLLRNLRPAGLEAILDYHTGIERPR